MWSQPSLQFLEAGLAGVEASAQLTSPPFSGLLGLLLGRFRVWSGLDSQSQVENAATAL